MIDLKTFNGTLDTDSPNENIGQHSVKMARNIRYRGERKNVGTNLRAENIEGTTLIPYNQPAGINECIGGFYDEIKQRVFGFFYNSNGNHSIRILYMDDLSMVNLITNGTNADSDVLDFDLDNPIYEVKMLYGDETQGDTLYFNDSSKVPCQINIESTLAGTFGTMKREFLEVIKYPASRPPYVVYGNDNTVTVNTLRKKLFRFMTRAVYYNRQKSVTSIRSECPMPIGAGTTTVDQDPTKNCVISVVYETLDADVEKIEILGQVSGKSDENGIVDPNSFSDPFLITTIDKNASGLADNDIAIYKFYNNQAYTEIDPEDAVQLFDLVPLEANALEFLNGNVPIYAGITEGFDPITLTGSNSSLSFYQKNTQLPYAFVGSQSGDSAFGTGTIHLVITGVVAAGYTFQFITTNHTIGYFTLAPTTTDAINGLAAAAVVAGFTVVSSDSENLYITKTGESLQMVVRATPPILDVSNGPAYNWNDKQAYCINYFDKGGRTIGAQTIPDFSFQTVNYTEVGGIPYMPYELLSITNRPPLDAYYFTFGRTKSLAKQKFLYWVSDTTYKDSQYAWIGIENLNTFIANQKSGDSPSTSAHLAYDFSPGDRIRFVKVLSGSVNTIYTNNDFEIVGQQLSPTINGTKRAGQYIKINLPTTSGTFDFGTSDFANYFIELYTPAQSVGDNLNKYYEFGERFTIGEPGTATRYHQGMSQNQTSNLSQPAVFTFNKGPFYYRNRSINVGAEYRYTLPAYEQGIGRTTLGFDYVSQSYNDPNITPHSSLNASLAGFNIQTNTDRAILNVTSGTYTFRITGSITVSFNDFGEQFSYYLQDSNLAITYLVPPQPITQGPHTFPIDVTFQMTPNTRIFIFGYSYGNYHNSKTYTAVDFKITRQLPFSTYVVDANYSDYYPSKVNSDARPTIVEPLAKRSYNPVLMRWAKPNLINTNINEANRFTALNFDEIDLTKGDIEVLSVENRILNVIQRRGCGWFAIYGKMVQDSSGKQILTTTDEILTKNNITYLAGTYGVGNQKGGFAKTKLGYYFTDPVRGGQVRRSMDGLIPINELYFGQYYISGLITPYTDDYVRTNGSKSKILGYYDYYEEQFVTMLQGGTFNGNTIAPQMFSFNEDRNAYCTFYDELPEWALCAKLQIIEWKNGNTYIRNNTTKWGERFGVQTFPSITLVFNDKEQVKKVFNALAYQSNQIWVSDIIVTSMVNPQTGLRQESSLIEQDFEITDNVRYAALLRDKNSLADARQALLEGDWLNGNWVQVTLVYKGSDFATLFSPYIQYQVNPRNF